MLLEVNFHVNVQYYASKDTFFIFLSKLEPFHNFQNVYSNKKIHMGKGCGGHV